jgi:putative ABC transport system substrate-binding protein
LQEATKTIPIVFATAGDPVSTGLVASLARPGGHTTGFATIGDDLAGKRLELLREVVPHLRRLALMGNVGNDFTVLEMGQLRNAAALLGLEVSTLEIRQAQDAHEIGLPRDRRGEDRKNSNKSRKLGGCGHAIQDAERGPLG